MDTPNVFNSKTKQKAVKTCHIENREKKYVAEYVSCQPSEARENDTAENQKGQNFHTQETRNMG